MSGGRATESIQASGLEDGAVLGHHLLTGHVQKLLLGGWASTTKLLISVFGSLAKRKIKKKNQGGAER